MLVLQPPQLASLQMATTELAAIRSSLDKSFAPPLLWWGHLQLSCIRSGGLSFGGTSAATPATAATVAAN